MSHSNYSISNYSNAFERHLERQESERHRRYADHIKRQNKNKVQKNENESRKNMLRQGMLNQSFNNGLQGASIVLTGEPRMKVHQKRQQIRDKMTINTYKSIQDSTNIRFYPAGDGASLDIKPDVKYVSVHEWCEKERKNGIKQQISDKQHFKQESREIERKSQQNYVQHMSKIDEIASKIERMKKQNEVQFANQERQRYNAKKSKEHARLKVEKD